MSRSSSGSDSVDTKCVVKISSEEQDLCESYVARLVARNASSKGNASRKRTATMALGLLNTPSASRRKLDVSVTSSPVAHPVPGPVVKQLPATVKDRNALFYKLSELQADRENASLYEVSTYGVAKVLFRHGEGQSLKDVSFWRYMYKPHEDSVAETTSFEPTQPWAYHVIKKCIRIFKSANSKVVLGVLVPNVPSELEISQLSTKATSVRDDELSSLEQLRLSNLNQAEAAGLKTVAEMQAEAGGGEELNLSMDDELEDPDAPCLDYVDADKLKSNEITADDIATSSTAKDRAHSGEADGDQKVAANTSYTSDDLPLKIHYFIARAEKKSSRRRHGHRQMEKGTKTKTQVKVAYKNHGKRQKKTPKRQVKPPPKKQDEALLTNKPKRTSTPRKNANESYEKPSPASKKRVSGRRQRSSPSDDDDEPDCSPSPPSLNDDDTARVVIDPASLVDDLSAGAASSAVASVPVTSSVPIRISSLEDVLKIVARGASNDVPDEQMRHMEIEWRRVISVHFEHRIRRYLGTEHVIWDNIRWWSSVHVINEKCRRSDKRIHRCHLCGHDHYVVVFVLFIRTSGAWSDAKSVEDTYCCQECADLLNDKFAECHDLVSIIDELAMYARKQLKAHATNFQGVDSVDYLMSNRQWARTNTLIQPINAAIQLYNRGL